MKRKQLKELDLKSDRELKEILDKLTIEVKKLLVNRASGKLKNVSLIREKKKEIAQIKTKFRERELSQL